MRTGCAKMAERINVLLGVETAEDPKNIVLDVGPTSGQWMGFNAAFSRLLWPLVLYTYCSFY